MIFAIHVGTKKFDFDETTNIADVFEYCEKEYGFEGEEWNKIKAEYDSDELEEWLEKIGVPYEEYDDE